MMKLPRTSCSVLPNDRRFGAVGTGQRGEAAHVCRRISRKARGRSATSGSQNRSGDRAKRRRCSRCPTRSQRNASKQAYEAAGGSGGIFGTWSELQRMLREPRRSSSTYRTTASLVRAGRWPGKFNRTSAEPLRDRQRTPVKTSAADLISKGHRFTVARYRQPSSSGRPRRTSAAGRRDGQIWRGQGRPDARHRARLSLGAGPHPRKKSAV